MKQTRKMLLLLALLIPAGAMAQDNEQAIHRANLAQFPMKMDDTCRSSPFMQVINILCDNRHLMLFLQLSYHAVSIVRLHLGQFFPPPIIEVKALLRLIIEGIRTGQVNPLLVSPHAILTTECTQSAFSTNARTRQKNYMLSSHITPFRRGCRKTPSLREFRHHC